MFFVPSAYFGAPLYSSRKVVGKCSNTNTNFSSTTKTTIPAPTPTRVYLWCTKNPRRHHRCRRAAALSPQGSPSRQGGARSRGRSTASPGAWRRDCWERPPPTPLLARPTPLRSPATAAGSLAAARSHACCMVVVGWHGEVDFSYIVLCDIMRMEKG